MQKNKFPVSVILLFSLLVGFALCPSITTESEFSWSEGYNTIQELIKNADVIMEGTLSSANPEIRGNLVFTRSNMHVNEVIKGSVQKNQIIQVLQTGGQLNNKTTVAPKELPLFQSGETYYLFLKETPVNQKYGQYYVVLGGYQGAAKINAQKKLVPLYQGNSRILNSATTTSILSLATTLN